MIPRKLDEIKEHFGGLLDDETAKLLEEYINGKEPVVRLSEIAGKKGKVLVEGRVVKVFPVRYFSRESWEGKVGSVYLEDGCVVRVNFWNEAATVIEAGDVVEGAKLKLRGYSRNGELNVNDPADVEITVDYTTISELKPGLRVNVKGWVSGIGDPERAEEIHISDKTGRVKVLLEPEIYFRVDIGDYIEILNGYVVERSDGEIEIHADRNSRVKMGE